MNFPIDYNFLYNNPDTKVYCTSLFALNPHTHEMSKWEGLNVYARSFEEAQKWCDENMGYLKVDGELSHEGSVVLEGGDIVNIKSHPNE